MLELAFRELWSRRGSLALQILALAIALAAIAASDVVRRFTTTSAVRGASCADGAFKVTAKLRNGGYTNLWTGPQAKALADAAGPRAARVAGTIVRAADDARADVAIVTPNFFELFCIETAAHRSAATGPEPGAAVVRKDLVERLGLDATIQLSGSELRVAATTPFRGMHAFFPDAVWVLPIDGRDLGVDLDVIDAPVVDVWLVPGKDVASADRLMSRVHDALAASPGLFAQIEALKPLGNAALGAEQSDRIQRAATLLQLFAGGLLVFALINIVVYYAGRTGALADLASTLAALGAPPRALLLLAVAEPVVLGATAFLIAFALAGSLANAVLAGLDPTGGNLSAGGPVDVVAPAILLLAMLAILAGVRFGIFLQRVSPARGRSLRTTLRLLPWLLATETALAVVLLAGAVHTSVGLWRALPPETRMRVDDVVIVPFRVPASGARRIDDVGVRWAAIRDQYLAGVDAALLGHGMPFPTLTYETATLFREGRQVDVRLARVSSNYFDVLGLPIQHGPGLGHTTSIDLVTGDPTSIVLNKAASDSLFGPTSVADGAIEKATMMTSAAGVRASPSVVMGTVDEGLRLPGARVEVQPVAYVPLTVLDARAVGYVAVRSTGGPELDAAITRAISALVPGAEIDAPRTARAVLDAATRQERAIATIMALLAAGALFTSSLGIVAISLLVMSALRTDIAVRCAVGATKSQAIARVARRILPAVAVGIVIGFLPAMWVSATITSLLFSTSLAGNAGPVVSVAVVGSLAAAVFLLLAREVVRAPLMEWLRYE